MTLHMHEAERGQGSSAQGSTPGSPWGLPQPVVLAPQVSHMPSQALQPRQQF